MSRIANPAPLRQREPRQRDKAYLGWIARRPCLACACRGIFRRPVEVAHIRSSYPEAGSGWREFGKAEKPHDWRTYPACRACHREGPDAQHRSNEREWFARLGVYPPRLCEALRSAFEAGESGDKIILRASRGEYRACQPLSSADS